MSSVLSNKKTRKPRTPKLSNSGPKLSEKVLLNIESLSIYNSFNPLNQQMIKLVQNMYNSRDITTIQEVSKQQHTHFRNGVVPCCICSKAFSRKWAERGWTPDS